MVDKLDKQYYRKYARFMLDLSKTKDYKHLETPRGKSESPPKAINTS